MQSLAQTSQNAMRESTLIAVYADGGVIGANPSSIGGTWAYCLVNARDERAATGSGAVTPAELGSTTVTNNQTELLALVTALEALPDGWHGAVYSDSQVTLARLTQARASWRNIPTVLRERAFTALRRLDRANVQFVQLAGHPTKAELAAGQNTRGVPVSVHNVWCDSACRQAARQPLAHHTLRCVSCGIWGFTQFCDDCFSRYPERFTAYADSIYPSRW